MTDLEKLLEDYFKDMAYIAHQKYEWLPPEQSHDEQLKRTQKRLKRFTEKELPIEKPKQKHKASNRRDGQKP